MISSVARPAAIASPDHQKEPVAKTLAAASRISSLPTSAESA